MDTRSSSRCGPAAAGRSTCQPAPFYPALHRLERAGLARGSWSEGPGRRRRVYELTAAGRGALTDQRVSWWQFAGAVSTVMGGGGGPVWTP
ncbi:MAG TPA: helix-turn-helix transcriptional regulator, partial [Nakamurella sp.]